MSKGEEQAYIRGERAAWRALLLTAIRGLGCDVSVETHCARLASERVAAIAVLRRLCRDHGDNDWDETLHLADIIEKHLADHLR